MDITGTTDITDITGILPVLTAMAVITASTGICLLPHVPRMGLVFGPLPLTTPRRLRERGLCSAIAAFRLGLDSPWWRLLRSTAAQWMMVATGRIPAGENALGIRATRSRTGAVIAEFFRDDGPNPCFGTRKD